MHPGPACAFLPCFNQRWAGCHRKPQRSGKGGTEAHIPQREKRTGASKNSPHIPAVCHGRGSSASPSGGMEGSEHSSSHMEANTYLIHQGGGIKKAQGPRRDGGGLGFRAGTGPGGRRARGRGVGVRLTGRLRGSKVPEGRAGVPGGSAIPPPRPRPLARAHLPAPCPRGRGCARRRCAGTPSASCRSG